MTMRTDIGRSLAKRLHTALADRKPTRKEKWACNTLKKLGHNHGGPTAAVGAPTGPVDIDRPALRPSIPASASAPGAILPLAPPLSLEGRQHA